MELLSRLISFLAAPHIARHLSFTSVVERFATPRALTLSLIDCQTACFFCSSVCWKIFPLLFRGFPQLTAILNCIQPRKNLPFSRICSSPFCFYRLNYTQQISWKNRFCLVKLTLSGG
jgi:hypothetical protein